MYNFSYSYTTKKKGPCISARPMLGRVLEILNAGDETLSDIFRRHSQSEALPYQDFAGRVRRVLNAESCAVFLVEVENNTRYLELKSEDCDTGYRHPQPAPKLPIQSVPKGGLTSHLAHLGRIVRLHGRKLRANPYLAGNPALHLVDRVDHSLLSFPLKDGKGNLIGLVKVQNKKDQNGRAGPRGQFSDLDVALAAFLSTRLVVALQGRQFVSFFKTLLRSQSGSNSASFEAEALKKALALIGADKGAIALWNDRRKGLYFKAQEGDGDKWPGKRVPPGVMQTVWKQQRSILIDDVRNYEGRYFEADNKTLSEVAVLIATRDDATGQRRRIGVLNAESYLPNNFDGEDQEMLEGVADSLADAFGSKLPEVSLHEALASLSTKGRGFAEPEKLLKSILERVRDTHGFDRGVVYVAEEMSAVLRLGAQLGCDDQQHRVGKYAEEVSKGSLAKMVWRDGIAVYVENPRVDKRVWKEGLKLFRIKGPMIALPLIHSGKTLGVLLTWSSKGPHPRPQHLRQLAPFAQVAAAEIAISRAYYMLDEWIHTIAQPSQNVRNLLHAIGRAEDGARKREFMSVLKSEASRLVYIVERSRLFRQHQRVAPAQVVYSLRDAIQDIVGAHQRQAEEFDVLLTLEAVWELKCSVRGDENRMKIALGELITNALKHSPPKSTVKVTLSETDGGYNITVADQGPGIPDQHARSIFDPFCSFSLSGEQAGTGLGLTIAGGIILEEGGTITFSPNQNGQGAIFTVGLPGGGK